MPVSRERTWDLETLQGARGLGDWVFEQVRPFVRGRVAEVGAGIGTYTERILAAGVDDLLLVEPDRACAARLRGRFPGVTVSEDELPHVPALLTGDRDLVVALNVVEHVTDDFTAVATMAGALRAGGVLTLLVPGHAWLYGGLDRDYGHARRYGPARLRTVVEAAGLEVVDLHRFNALGIPGWLIKNGTRVPRIDARSVRAYESLLPAYRRLVEDRVRLPVGLSLVVHARRPA